MSFGETLKELRIERGMSKADLGRALEVSRHTIYEWENGNRTPKRPRAVEIARVFDVDVSRIWPESGAEHDAIQRHTPNHDGAETRRRHRRSRANICFDCQRACGDCSWSAFFEPVEGWTAKPTTVKGQMDENGVIEDIPTYHITACPLFVRDAKRAEMDEEGME